MKENESDYDNYYNGTSVQSSFKISNKDKFQIYSEFLTKCTKFYQKAIHIMSNYSIF